MGTAGFATIISLQSDVLVGQRKRPTFPKVGLFQPTHLLKGVSVPRALLFAAWEYTPARQKSTPKFKNQKLILTISSGMMDLLASVSLQAEVCVGPKEKAHLSKGGPFPTDQPFKRWVGSMRIAFCCAGVYSRAPKMNPKFQKS